jgi:hypothetical protein
MRAEGLLLTLVLLTGVVFIQGLNDGVVVSSSDGSMPVVDLVYEDSEFKALDMAVTSATPDQMQTSTFGQGV